MPQKKPTSTRLKNTLSDLDTAMDEWDSITNKPAGEQASDASPVQEKAKSLFKELRDQISQFDDIPILDPNDRGDLPNI